jgi:hypothetical protein
VNANRNAAGAGIDIISRQSTLPSRIELTVAIEGQGVRRNDHALAQKGEDIGWQGRPVHGHHLSR